MDTRDSNTGQPHSYSTGAPPQAAYYPPQPPAAPKKKHKGLWITLAALGILAAIGIGNADGKSTDTPASSSTASRPTVPDERGPVEDVTMSPFTVDSIGAVTAPMTVTNHSSKASNYIIEFEVLNSAGVKIGDGIASTNNLAPGQTAQLSGIALSVSGQPDRVKLTRVTRYASG